MSFIEVPECLFVFVFLGQWFRDLDPALWNEEVMEEKVDIHYPYHVVSLGLFRVTL